MTLDWWTLGIEAVNIVILIWLLGRFFWRPVAAMIAARRDAAAKMVADAEAAGRTVAAEREAIAATRAGFAAEHDQLLADARAEAERARAEILEAARTEAEAARAAAATALARERAAAEQAWRDRAGDLAVEIAGRLLARHDAAATRARFLDWLVAALAALPAADRAAAAAPGAALQATSATPLDPAEADTCRHRIAKALGAEPRIDFAADPGLIAGLELTGPGFTVRNSWRADLARILAELRHDHRA